MNGFDTIKGKVVGHNSVLHDGRRIECYENSMQAAEMPRPLNLDEYMGKIVSVSGQLHGSLWMATFIDVVSEEGVQEITGKVVGLNDIEGPDGRVNCYRHGMQEARYMPLYLWEYMGKTVMVTGMLHGNSLYRASVIRVVEAAHGMDPAKEAKSLNDLLRIRAANRDKIETVNKNLGTALGFKWTNGQKTEHPCIIVFVPNKTVSWLVPENEKVAEILEGTDGTWCLTDVVVGGKAESEDDFAPLPELSRENKIIIRDLKSGRVGLRGGIQLAFYEDGIETAENSYVGTAGIAVRHKNSNKVGFLTNQHVADAPGRRIYHPWHGRFRIGMTYSTKEVEADQNWYNDVIDESQSYVRCDCAFVEVSNYLASYVESGLHAIGNTGPLLSIDSDTMDIIGQRVISIGRTRGIQRGTIVAYAYEFSDEYYSVYTDLLIIGEEGKSFSWHGDSGKIIVTDDDEHRPVALLWGGWQERLRQGREQENWSYAIDLGKVLDLMNLELL